MSLTAFKRDLDDPKAIRDFADQVQSPERLRLLLILTVADIRAVGPKVWNAWKAELLRELYYRAQEVLTGDSTDNRRGRRIEAAKQALRDELHDWPTEDIERHLDLVRDGYWIGFDTQTLLRHATVVRDAMAAGKLFAADVSVDPVRDITEIVVYAPDHPGLFASITGAMALGGASIVDAKIVTLTDGMALDTFWVQDEDGRAYDDTGRIERLSQRIEATVTGKLRAGREISEARDRSLPQRANVFKVPPRVLVDNAASKDSTVIEVNCRDRLGLLYDLTSALTQLRLQISSAHIATYGERAVDVFYVRDSFGLKVRDEQRIDAIRQTLLEAAVGDGPSDSRERSAWSADMAATVRGPQERTTTVPLENTKTGPT